MPNCDFYASGDDFSALLDHVFAFEELVIYETYSVPDTRLKRFDSSEQVFSRYPALGTCKGDAPSVLLALCPKQYLDQCQIRRIEFDRERVKYAKFRESIEGWGLIQLNLGGLGPKGLVHSHTNHNSQARAVKWRETYPQMGPIDVWDFSVVNSLSRKLNNIVRKHLAVDTLGSRPVMPAAAKELKSNVRAI